MKENDDMTAMEVYDIVKPQGRLEVPVRVNISGYAVKVGPDVYGHLYFRKPLQKEVRKHPVLL